VSNSEAVEFSLLYPDTTSRLYISSSSGAETGYAYLVLPADGPSSPVSLAEALGSSAYKATFVFSAADPGLTEATAKAFLVDIAGVIPGGSSRGMIWLRDGLNISGASTAALGMAANGSSLSSGLSGAQVNSSLSLNIPNGTALAVSGTDITLTGTGGIKLGFSGSSAPSAYTYSGSLPFAGATPGVPQFTLYIQRLELYSDLRWGFQFLAPSDSPQNAALPEWLPLADAYHPNATDELGLVVRFDPSDVFNTSTASAATAGGRTTLSFTGQNKDDSPTVLASYFRTIYGDVITLTPVAAGGRLVFALAEAPQGGARPLLTLPDGDFTLSVDGAGDGDVFDLMCGLNGTEYIAFRSTSSSYAGDSLRFTAQQAAYAPVFPLPSSSPLGPPTDPNAALLDATYLTSWASVVPATGGNSLAYVAQPQGAPLFGRDALIHGKLSTLFGPMDPSVVLPSGGSPFPLAPYAGAAIGDGESGFDASQIEAFEASIVSPTRRSLIGTGDGTTTTRRAALFALDSANSGYNTTTPTGLLVSVGDGGAWSKILLAQNLDPVTLQMYFGEPDPVLQQAFQSNQIFLVLTNNRYLESSGTEGGTFAREMNIGDWSMAAEVGGAQTYNDYSNIILVKGRSGALYDPDDPEGSLVSSVDAWTQKDDFSSPDTSADGSTNNGAGDQSQQVVLSQWLQSYFLSASQQDDPSFDTFNQIATDPNWTGILILRMDIAQLPDNLTGLLSGVAYPDDFYAHHLGIEISQIANEPDAEEVELSTSSSMFGLIYYQDPAFTPPISGEPPGPIQPTAGVAYDFRLLMLKVLFQNTSVTQFESYAQLTVNELFGMNVLSMGDNGNSYNAILLSGSMQNNNGETVYSLGTTSDSTFYFNSTAEDGSVTGNNLFNKIEVIGAQMSSRGQDASGQDVTWFGLQGFLDFAVLQGTDGQPFDVLSFGNEAGADTLRQGLSYNNLGLQLVGAIGDQTFTFSTDEITFDRVNSTPRAASLDTQFALELDSLLSGDADNQPSGYLDVITSARLTGVTGGDWYGLRFKLNLGTPGELAGKVDLTSYLFVGWSPSSSGDSGYQASVGLQLPGTGGGASLISLQTVLSLSIGKITLMSYQQDGDTYYLMNLTEIAIKFLGLLKIPPSGSTMFYLFGNPEAGGDPSGLGWYAMYRNQPES